MRVDQHRPGTDMALGGAACVLLGGALTVLVLVEPVPTAPTPSAPALVAAAAPAGLHLLLIGTGLAAAGLARRRTPRVLTLPAPLDRPSS